MNLRYLNLDFAGRRALAASEREADEAIEEWQSFSNNLKNKLAAAEKKLAIAEAYLAGRDAQRKALREELQKIDPGNPVLTDLKRLSGLAMAESFAGNGYHYDPEKERLRKL